MEIIFVRHGETLWNVENRLQGQTNESHLTENGIKQAEDLANKIKKEEYDIIISSPLERCKLTANIINKSRDKLILFDDALIERGYGNLEGYYQKNGKYNIKELWDYKVNYKENNVEPVQDFFDRIYKFFSNMINENKYEKVLLVSHSGVSIAMRAYFEGFSKDGNLLELGIKNCDIIKYEI